MTRLRTDQACLEAQLQAQAAQSLTAELAVSCPDCGVEAGRACCDSFGRAVKSHLGRVVELARAPIGERRDTEPCPPIELLEAPMSPSFRELIERHERAIVETIASMQVPRASLERLPGLASWLPEQTPTAPDCAPAGTDAPGEVASTPTRPVCACGQTIWRELATECSDCSMDESFQAGAGPSLDKRIAETKSDDAPQCAWSTPTSEGEGWR